MKSFVCAAAIAASCGLAGSAWGATPVMRLFQEGDALAGSTVDAVNAAFMSGNGTVATLGTLEDGRRFVWVNDGVAWTSDLFPDTVTGAESSIGVGDDGSWTASFSLPASGTSGTDDSWAHSSNQTIAREFDDYPFIDDQIVGFASRPSMDDNGTAYTVGGYRLDDGSNSGSDGRAFWRSTNPGAANPTYDVVYQSFEVIDGFTVGNGGVDFTYDVSGNGNSLITEIVFNDTPTTGDDNMIYHIDLNSGVKTRLGREGDATGAGDNFDNWDGVSVNNRGDYLIHGDTDGDTSTDEFILVNGDIVYREGNLVDGVAMDLVDAADINDHGQMVAVFNTEADSGIESLVFGAEAGNRSTWEIILTVGDTLDFDGDGLSDGTLDDFNISAFSNPFEIGNGRTVWLEVDYTDLAGGSFEAIIGVAVPTPGAAGLLALGGLAAARRRR
ncbi:MAG: hypothetical protein AAF356_01115 [Planctomycetota bacterium]